jgi:hypothetical protein
MACASHTILLAASIFNPLIDVSFWKCRCRFAFPSQSVSGIRGVVMQGFLMFCICVLLGQSLCCLFNDYIYIYNNI